MNNRRRLVLAFGAGALAAPFGAYAQHPGKVWRIGVLERNPTEYVEAFKHGLRELGYVEEKNIVFENRWANGKLAEFPRLAAELVGLKVDVILAGSTPAALAAREATRTIPIVFAVVADPIGAKLIASLSKPGGNLTGMTTNNIEIIGKRLEILKELSGGKAARAAMLFNSADPSNVLALSAMEDSARKLGMTFRPFLVKVPEDFEGAFTAMVAARIDALFVPAGVLTNSYANRIVELAAKNRVPSMYGAREFVNAGGLASYSASFLDNYRRAAIYVDKILKGAMPRDLPVEQASKLELVINRKTAKALGITIPQSLLISAAKIIE